MKEVEEKTSCVNVLVKDSMDVKTIQCFILHEKKWVQNGFKVTKTDEEKKKRKLQHLLRNFSHFKNYYGLKDGKKHIMVFQSVLHNVKHRIQIMAYVIQKA